MQDPSKKTVREQYSRQAHLYAKSRPHARGDTLSLMARWAEGKGGESVLDVATGCGFCAFALAPQVARVVGLDLTPSMLREAARMAEERGITNIEFREGDAEALPFPDAHFDIVTCRISAHHFSSPATFLSESWRVLVSGGRLILADTSAPEEEAISHWHNETERLRDPSHIRNLTPSQWREAVIRAGFLVTEFTTDTRSELEFSDWVKTSGSSPGVISLLLARFERAPLEIKRAFRIESSGSRLSFSWPITALKAIKP